MRIDNYFVNVLQTLELENKIILNPISVSGSFEER